MSNKETIELNEIKVEEHQVREVLKCVIHTIIFNRALGHVSPRDMDLQLINVSYVEVADDDIERQVEEGLRKVEEHLKTLPRSTSSSMPQVDVPDGIPLVVRLSFYELVSRAAFTKTYQEKVYWEIWRIQLRIVTSSQSAEDRETRQKQLQADVDSTRTVILHNADSKKDHIPPVKPGSPGALTYPFEIIPDHLASLVFSIERRKHVANTRTHEVSVTERKPLPDPCPAEASTAEHPGGARPLAPAFAADAHAEL